MYTQVKKMISHKNIIASTFMYSNPMKAQLGDQLILFCGDSVSNLFIQVNGYVQHYLDIILITSCHTLRLIRYNMRLAMQVLVQESSTTMATAFLVIS